MSGAFKSDDTFPQAGRQATWTAYGIAVVVGALISYVTLELKSSYLAYYSALAVAIVVLVAVALPLIDRSRHRDRISEAKRRWGVVAEIDAD